MLDSSAIYLYDKAYDLPSALNLIIASLELIHVHSCTRDVCLWLKFLLDPEALTILLDLSSFSVVLVKPIDISYQLLYLEKPSTLMY